MKPSDEQLQQLNNALFNAFTLSDLARLVRIELHIELEEISSIYGDSDLPYNIEYLVRYCAAQEGGLHRLLDAALRQYPNDQTLRELADRWRTLQIDPLPMPPGYPRASSRTHDRQNIGDDVAHGKGIDLGFGYPDGSESLESTSAGDASDMSFSIDPAGPFEQSVTNTGGGANIGGDANVGRDLVGRDQINMSHVHQLVIVQGDMHGDPVLSTRGMASSKGSPLIEEIIRLDVATPRSAFVDMAFEIAVSIRQPDSPMLDVVELTEVTSEEGAIFRTAEDELVSYRVEIVAPGCDVEPPSYIFKLRPGRDSRVYFYQITPRREGRVAILVNAYQMGDDALVAQTRLRLAVNLPVAYPSDTSELDAAFAPLLRATILDAPAGEQTTAQQKIVALRMEAARGNAAQDDVMAGLIQDLVDLSPDVAQTVAAVFADSLLNKLLGPATRFVLRRISG